MRRLTVLLCTLFLATAAHAQSNTISVAQKGEKAVLFNFSGLSNLNLGAYEGGFGGKYFISDGVAVRGMLMFGINNQTTNTNPKFTDNTLSFGIAAALEYHLPLFSQVSPYFGGGIFFNSTGETRNPGSSKTTNSSFGVGALGGVEYFFNQNLSLAAEYQFGFTSSTNTTSGSPNTSEFQLGFQTAGLTLGVYF